MIINLNENSITQKSFFYRVIHSKAFIYILLLATNLLLAAFLSNNNEKIGIVIITVVVALPILIIGFIKPDFGFYSSFIFASFVFIIKRLTNYYTGSTYSPFGIIVELLLINALMGALIRNKNEKRLKIENYNNPVFYIFIVWILYAVIQIINPHAISLAGWITEMRESFQFISIIILFDYTIQNKKEFIQFTKIWISIVILAGVYGVIQNIIYLPAWDLHWVTGDDLRIKLNFINGRWRIFSFLSDVAACGQFMALGIITLLLVLIGEFKFKTKIIAGVFIIPILLTLGYSGTRTAYVMAAIGVIFYILITLNKVRTILFSIIISGFFLFVLFAPIYDGTIFRIRSVLKPSEDASFQLRNKNRKRIQPYILSHPFGGGPNATNGEISPGHFLSSFNPDSGYLKTAVEFGWIGLAIIITLFATTTIYNIKIYKSLHNKKIESIFIIYCSVFYAFTIGYYSQMSMFQLPYNYILIASFILGKKISKFDYININSNPNYSSSY